MNLGGLLAEGLWKAPLVIAVGAWLYGAYHMVAASFWAFGDPNDENRPAEIHRRKSRVGGALFVGLLLFALVVGLTSHQF